MLTYDIKPSHNWEGLWEGLVAYECVTHASNINVMFCWTRYMASTHDVYCKVFDKQL